MAFNLDKLAAIAVNRSESAVAKAKAREENREWLSISQDIALCIRYYLRNSGITQKSLAEKLGVSPAYIGKLLKGNENLTIETICKLQKVLGENIITVARPYVNTQMYVLPKCLVDASETVFNRTYSERIDFKGEFFAATDIVA